jgi:hypothetical protein
LPTSNNKEIYIRQIGIWILTQKKNYIRQREIMKNYNVRLLWKVFTTKYDVLFRSKEQLWKIKLNDVISYIEEYKKLPSGVDKDRDIQSLAFWISTQKANYTNRKKSMKNNNILILWEEFYSKNIKLFKKRELLWLDNLQYVKEYIKQNNKMPSYCSQNKKIKYLGVWIKTQEENYDKNHYIMKNEINRKLWEQFITDNHLLYGKTEYTKWLENLELVREYINENGKFPTSNNNDKKISSLATWIATQRQSYKKNENIMKDNNLKNIWREFVNEYKRLFMSNTERWLEILQEVEAYINIHKKYPCEFSQDPNTIKIARWVKSQRNNYKNSTCIMKDLNIKTIWEEFINRNEIKYKTNIEKWYDSSKKLEEYIQEYNKLPSRTTDKYINSLANWIYEQKNNYKGHKKIMANETIREKWCDLTSKYPHLF